VLKIPDTGCQGNSKAMISMFQGKSFPWFVLTSLILSQGFKAKSRKFRFSWCLGWIGPCVARDAMDGWLRAKGRSGKIDYVTATGRFDLLKYNNLTSPNRSIRFITAVNPSARETTRSPVPKYPIHLVSCQCLDRLCLVFIPYLLS